jgi:hypothetical protein
MWPLMAETANDARVGAAAEIGIVRRRGRARAPRLDAGRRPRRHRGNADRPDHREVLRVAEAPARLAGPPEDRRPATGDLTAPRVGGAARFVLRHHPMFSINSLCRLFGKQYYDRAFPSFSRPAADGRQIDLSAQLIELVEKLGIAYDVMAVGPARRARKTLNAVS